MGRIQHTDQELIQLVVDCMIAHKSQLALQDMSQLIDIARAVERSISDKYGATDSTFTLG